MSNKLESHSGTLTGYKVEARVLAGFAPKQVGKQIFDGEWRAVAFEISDVGVKPHHYNEPLFREYSLFSYEAAQALRWWLLAEIGSFAGIETQLREYSIKFHSEAHQKEACDKLPNDTHEHQRRSNRRPATKRTRSDEDGERTNRKQRRWRGVRVD